MWFNEWHNQMYISGVKINQENSSYLSNLPAIHFANSKEIRFRLSDNKNFVLIHEKVPKLKRIYIDRGESSTKCIHFTTSNDYIACGYTSVGKKRIQLTLPSHVKEIIMPDCVGHFEQFPSSLKKLNISCIKHGQLPSTLRSLTLHRCDYLSKLVLPSKLKRLHLNFHCPDRERMPNLPANLKHLKMENTNAPLMFPSRLKSLNMFQYNFNIVSLPDTLIKLKLDLFTGALPRLPDSLRILKLGLYDRNAIDYFPKNLRVLILKSYNQSALELKNCTRLKHLELHAWSKMVLELSDSIRTLILRAHDHVLTLPLNLKHLELPKQTISISAWPASLKIIQLDAYSQPLDALPEHLQTLFVPCMKARLPTPLPPRLSYVIMASK